jgi:salicylate hydroxylase
VVDRQFLNSMVIWCGHDTHLVQYRLRGGTVMNNVAVFVSPRFKRGEKDFGQPDELHEMFAPAVPRVRDMLKYISLERNWVLHDRDPVANWTKGCATLLGDAAHPTLQYLAQGACMAFEDGLVLASEVARHGDDFNAAFLAYQGRRMNRTARVVLSARFFAEVCHAGGGARLLRNELLGKRSPDDPWEADWLYRGIDVD